MCLRPVYRLEVGGCLRRNSGWRPAFITVALALAEAATGATLLAAQSPEKDLRGEASDAVSYLPSDVSFIVQIDGSALAGSPLLPRLLERKEAANPLARALARPATLAKVRTIYVGFPAGFTPHATELPVVVAGTFDNERMLSDLASARGVKQMRSGERVLLEATGELGTSYAAALGAGTLALGDHASVQRMLEVWEEKRDGIPLELVRAIVPLEEIHDIAGAGRVPVALRGYLQAEGGAVAAPFATIDRVSFEGSLGRAMELHIRLHPATAEGRQAVAQALGALRVFGPSRFANDPEVLSAIQSMRFTAGSDAVDVYFTLPRSLLFQLL